MVRTNRIYEILEPALVVRIQLVAFRRHSAPDTNKVRVSLRPCHLHIESLHYEMNIYLNVSG